MINHVVILDISFDEYFADDLTKNIPDQVSKKLKSVINQILDGGRLPKSLNAHKAYREDLWIGYITRSNRHWRLLFWYDEDNYTVTFHRLLEHTRMDRYLDSI